MPSFKTDAVRRPSSNPSFSSAMITQQNEPTPQPNDDFSARRSGRVSTGQCIADNDTWVEALAVCEVATDPKKTNTSAKSGSFLKKLKSKSNMGDNENTDSNIQQQHEAEMAMAAQRLTLRPYFQSQNTGQRVWDEPPSGASNIVYATVESRKMAQAQLEEMRSTYAHASLVRRSKREEAAAVERSFASERNSSRKLSLPKLFRRSSSSMSENEGRTMSAPLVASSNSESAKTGIPSSILEESINLATESAYEQDLQMAMMLSMGIGKGSVMGVGDHPNHINEVNEYSSEYALTNNNCTPAAAARREKEQIEMAKALSLAEEKARHPPVDDYLRRKSDKSTKKHSSSRYTSSNDDPTEKKSQPVSQWNEMSAPAPTMNQIESDFDVGCYHKSGNN